MRIRVPGVITSRSPLGQNLAIAIDAAITVSVEEESLDWTVAHHDPHLPHDQTNMIVAVAEELAPWLLPHQLQITSTLPVGAGLGGSNAATIAGVLMANKLARLDLDDAGIKTAVARYEPYPAAVAAALTGGMQYRDPTSDTLTALPIAAYQWYIYTPDHFVEASVPAHYPFNDTTAEDYRGLVLALQHGDDAWLRGHFPIESLRSQVTPEYFPQAEMVTRAVLQCGGYGCFVAGNGPALVCLAPLSETRFATMLRRVLSAGDLLPIQINTTGALVSE
ncbi:GHMP family kinase ATP-binding protein [Lacticaseibacillus jixiensis]|uniref:GHMP family kinase ATP-binding protein n=1 Tax=Lacticaseibacillus jixiensis TaxID=3231926 RepID=UPI0036F23DF1